MQNAEREMSGRGLQWGVILAGILIFVLLFFADKTNLNNPSLEVKAPEKGAAQGPAEPEQNLRQLAGKPELPQSLQDSLSKLEGLQADESKIWLKGMAERLRDLGQIPLAAVYASQLSDLEPSVKNLLVAGALSRSAAEGFGNANDSLRFRAFSANAISLLEKADKEKPGDEAILIELGLAMAQSGKPEYSMQGIQKLVKVLEINPDNVEAAFQLGIFSMQTGQYEKAVGRLEKVLKLDPQNLEAKLLLAGAYRETGKKKEAISLLTSLAGTKENPEIVALATDMLNELKK